MKEERWLIWSIEHSAFWRPAHRGYVGRVEDAGRYNFEEALGICKGGNVSSRDDGYPDTDRNYPLHEVMCPAPEMIDNWLKNYCPICEGSGKISWKWDPKTPDVCPGCIGTGEI